MNVSFRDLVSESRLETDKSLTQSECMKIEPVISIHVVAVVQKIVIQKGVSYKYLNSTFYNKYIFIHYNLTDGNGDVEAFAE